MRVSSSTITVTRTASLLVLLTATLPAIAATPVPETLFGIKHGAVYWIGDAKTEGDLPIKRFTGVRSFPWQVGGNYYFEPSKANPAFPFQEKRETPDEEYYQSTHRLYLHPVIPDGLKGQAELKAHMASASVRWRVMTIEYSNDAEDLKSAHFWVDNLCANIAADLDHDPDVSLNAYDRDGGHRICEFAGSNRRLVISHYGTASYWFRLSFSQEYLDLEEDRIEKQTRKIRMDEIRPY